jgi:hypothetical protein
MTAKAALAAQDKKAALAALAPARDRLAAAQTEGL